MKKRFNAVWEHDLSSPGIVLPSDPDVKLPMKIINDLYMKNRSLVTDDYDASLDYLSKVIPLKMHEFPSGSEAGTWIVPKKWVVREAWIKHNGKTICDFKDHPMHLVSYSRPFRGVIKKEDLVKHLNYDTDRPSAIPFAFNYYYKEGWGFCLPYNTFKGLPDGEYEVLVDANLEDGYLKVGECVLEGNIKDSIIFCAHLCHPGQANDDLSGVAVGAALFRELAACADRRYTYRLVFLPENIGSACYLSGLGPDVANLKQGLFLEMLGNKNHLKIQESKNGNSLMDQVLDYVMKDMGIIHGVGPFRQICCNDEINFDGPGYNIPMPSISRWPYPEYHTSDDNPDIMSPGFLKESLNVLRGVVDIYEKNVFPRRKFRGNVFLSRYGLYEDLSANDTIEKLMLLLEGDKSVLDISRELNLPFDEIHRRVRKYYEAGLVSLENDSI